MATRDLGPRWEEPGGAGLVLTGGGARGAYQAGVLKRVSEIPALRDAPPPFRIITGSSAGAINGAWLATAGISGFHPAADRLAELWSELRFEQVIRTDALALASAALGWVRDFGLGWLVGAGTMHGLFDTTPLHQLISSRMPADAIDRSIRAGWLHALAVSATSYHSGRSFIFVQGRPGHPTWQRSRRVTLSTKISPAHISASAAIPIVFPPVAIQLAGGVTYFGDGALRQVTPFSPAIRLGAERVFAIGIRSAEAAMELLDEELPPADGMPSGHRVHAPPMSQIAGVFLNALFLDHLDTDLDHLHRMNELMRYYDARPPSTDSCRRSTCRPSPCESSSPLRSSPPRTSRWSPQAWCTGCPGRFE